MSQPTSGTDQLKKHAGYEFSSTANRVIDRTARIAAAWGLVSIAIGSLQVLVGALSPPVPGSAMVLIPSGLVQIVVGVFFRRASRSLREVVATEGHDVSHMMLGLHGLGTAFLAQIIGTIVAFLAGAAVIYLTVSTRGGPA